MDVHYLMTFAVHRTEGPAGRANPAPHTTKMSIWEMDCGGQALTQMGHETLGLAKTQQYDSTKRLAQGTFLPKPTLRQKRPKHTQQGQKETTARRTSYKQEQTWTLYSSF